MEFKYELIEGGIKLLDVELDQGQTYLEIAEIDGLQVIEIGKDFLYNNKVLTSINLPNVETIGDRFLYYNKSLTQISLPNVETIGDYFLYYNESLTSISLPNVKEIGYSFLLNNELLTHIDFNVSSVSVISIIRLLENCANLDTETLYRFYEVEDQEVKRLAQEHPNWREPTDWVLGDW